MYLRKNLNFLSLYMLLSINLMFKVIFLLYNMSKSPIEVYNISSDTDSTAYIQEDEESSTDEDEYIINKNNKADVFLNFSLELEPFYFNNLSVKSNLNIPLFLNVPLVLVKKYNMGCCNMEYLAPLKKTNVYYYIYTSLISDTSIIPDLMEIQHNIY